MENGRFLVNLFFIKYFLLFLAGQEIWAAEPNPLGGAPVKFATRAFCLKNVFFATFLEMFIKMDKMRIGVDGLMELMPRGQTDGTAPYTRQQQSISCVVTCDATFGPRYNSFGQVQ